MGCCSGPRHRCSSSPAFPVQDAVHGAREINALYFELVLAKQDAVQENRPLLPNNVKWAGAASLFLWTLVIICGRLIPYLPRWT